MNTHNMCFYGERLKIIPKLSLKKVDEARTMSVGHACVVYHLKFSLS